MNTSLEFLNMSWVASLGWSLLHSLWQGAIVLLLTIVVLRLIPGSKSISRYAISLAGIITILVLFAGTFVYLEFNSSSATLTEQYVQNELILTGHLFTGTLSDTIPSIAASGITFINLHIHKIFTIWLIGVVLLFIRLAGSFWYIDKIRRNSTLVSGTVLEQLNKLAYQMQIPRWIDLAENTTINSPMVIGVLKPMVLVPAGILAGLSTEQVESIFIHELTHIKRNDYLINIMQAIIEVILFFNPFVIVLSDILRKERENCCDDAVLDRLQNPVLYAKTLAQLEEFKYTNNQLVISFAGKKNYLLNRIKRIMEQTAKKQNGKGWILPVILLIVGLTSASWLTISPTHGEKNSTLNIQYPVSDTIVNPKIAVRTVVVQEPVKTEPIQIKLEEPVALSLDIEPVEIALNRVIDVDVDIAPIIDIVIDTIPPFNWETFDKTFDESFQKNYLESMSAMKESMRALEENLSKLKYDEVMTKEVQEKLRQIEMEQVAKIQKMEALYQTEIMKVQQEKMREVEEKMKALDKIQQEKLVVMEQKMKAFEKVMKEYEKELKEELVKDGYIKKGEEFSIHWKDENLEINGKKIKDKDQAKYKAMQEKYFKGNGSHINWE